MIMNVEKSYAVVLLVKSAELCFWYMDLWQDAADSSFMLSADVIPDLPDRLICSVVTRGPVPPVTKNLIIEGLCERTEYINIFLPPITRSFSIYNVLFTGGRGVSDFSVLK